MTDSYQPAAWGAVPQNYPPPGVPGAVPQSYPPPGAVPTGYPLPGVMGAVPPGYPQPGMAGAVPPGYLQPGMAGAVPPGYLQPGNGMVYPTAYVPVQTGYPAAPVFLAERVSQGKAAARTMNRMGLLALTQIGLSAGWGYVLAVLAMVLGVNFLAPDSYGLSTMTGAIVVLSTGLVPFLFFVAGRRSTVDYLKFEKVGFFSGLLCVLAGAGLMLLGNLLATFFYSVLEGTGYQPTQLETSEDTGTWLAFLIDFLTIAVLGPMLEEIMDRGIFIGSMRKYGIGFSVVGSALLFGLAHLEPGTVLFATNAGLVLGFIYARTNNLWLTMWIHMINNGMVILVRYGALFYPRNPDLFGGLLELSVMGVGLLSLIILLVCRRNMFMTRRSPNYDGPAQSLTFGQSAAAIARVPMFWVMVVIVVVYFVVMLV